MSKKEAGTAAPTVTRDEPTIWRVDDALWAELQPALVVEKPRKKPGRPRHDDRPIFDGLIWIARSGGQWKALPRDAVVDGAAIPRELCLDRGYDYAACREAATSRGYTPHIPPKRSAEQPLPPPGDPDRHPPRRWVVEACHSWFNRFRRLLVRWEKQAANYLAFVQLAAILIVYRKLRQ